MNSERAIPTRRLHGHAHDLLGRLTRVVQQHGSSTAVELEQFAYCTIGNLTSRSSLGTYAYASTKPHAVTSVGANTYSYDARGNQTLRVGPSIPGGQQQIDYTPFNLPSRMGRTSLTRSVRTQIAKDVELIQNRDIRGSTWHFFESPITGRKGPTEALEAALQAVGIQIEIH